MDKEKLMVLTAKLICDSHDEGFKEGAQAERESVRREIWQLDWIKIMNKAIKMRPTSWNKDPIREWRNASDEVVTSLMNECVEKEIFKDQWKEALTDIKKTQEPKDCPYCDDGCRVCDSE